jgi:hypothetical protein
MLLDVLTHGFCIVPILRQKVKMDALLDAQQGFAEWNPLLCRMV